MESMMDKFAKADKTILTRRLDDDKPLQPVKSARQRLSQGGHDPRTFDAELLRIYAQTHQSTLPLSLVLVLGMAGC